MENVRSFGEDGSGEICFTHGSAIYWILPDTPITHCNANSRPYECDIQAGFSPDANTNGIPDERETCHVSCDASTQPPVLNVAGFTCFLQRSRPGTLTSG